MLLEVSVTIELFIVVEKLMSSYCMIDTLRDEGIVDLVVSRRNSPVLGHQGCNAHNM
jgi:hypothetical protein